MWSWTRSGKSSFNQCRPLLKPAGIYVSSELGPTPRIRSWPSSLHSSGERRSCSPSRSMTRQMIRVLQGTDRLRPVQAGDRPNLSAGPRSSRPTATSRPARRSATSSSPSTIPTRSIGPLARNPGQVRPEITRLPKSSCSPHSRPMPRSWPPCEPAPAGSSSRTPRRPTSSAPSGWSQPARRSSLLGHPHAAVTLRQHRDVRTAARCRRTLDAAH